MPRLVIDARMIDQSGIGRYLQAVLPRVISSLGSRAEIALIGARAPLERAGVVLPRVTLIETAVGVYAPAEQLVLARAARHADALWVPHITVPFAIRCALAVTVHDAYYASWRRTRDVRLDKRLYTLALTAWAARRADVVLCDSSFTRDELAAAFGRARAPAQVIPLGVDHAWFDLRADGPSPHPRPYVLYVGNVKPHKNLPRLIRAFGRIRSQIPHDLLIAGRPDGGLGSDAVEREAAAVGGRVIFSGHVDEGRLRALYAHAACLAMPSLYEGFGLPPLEAMACGVPVVSSRSASLPEVCGDAAELFDGLDEADCARALLRVLTDAPRRVELVSRGRERARHFSWERCGEDTAAALARLL